MNKNVSQNIIFSLIIAIYISGCAYQKSIIKTPTQVSGLTGIYHKVNNAETLWSIAKAYNVDLEEIVKINRIPNAAQIEKGQLIFIPGLTRKSEGNFGQAIFLHNKKFIWPARGKIISYFGSLNNNRMNRGIDIEVDSDVNIFAINSGRVVFSDELRGYGKTIIIDHLDGFFSIYANNQDVLVKLNDNVSQGQIIAKLEKLSNSKSFVHLEIRDGYRPQNPLYYLP